ALRWILALAKAPKARSAAPISAANARPARTSAQRATPKAFGAKSTHPPAARARRAAGPERFRGWRRRPVVIPQLRDGDAPPSLPPSASTRDPPQYFNSLLTSDG